MSRWVGIGHNRPPDATEQQIHEAVAAWLDVVLPIDAVHTALDHAGKASKVVGAKLNARGAKKGWPDHLVLWHGRALFLEIKTRVGRLKPEQRAMRDAILAAGGCWALVRSIDDAATALSASRIPCRAL